MTTLLVHPGEVHGMEDIAWDDAALPEWIWRGSGRTANGLDWHWEQASFVRGANVREFVIERLLNRQWKDVLACVPTCGDPDCWRPSHLCITWRKD